MSKFVLIVEGKEARSRSGCVVIPAGEKFLVVEEPEGWVEATSCSYRGNLRRSRGLQSQAKVFDSVAAATEFAQCWKGHPWYCKPNGNYEVIEVRPVSIQVFDGYEAVTPASATAGVVAAAQTINAARAYLAGPPEPVPNKPAEPDSREPSDAELLELLPEVLRNESVYQTFCICTEKDNSGIFRLNLNTATLKYARAVLARYGHQRLPLSEAP